MIFQVAWRNVWRNRVRSLVVISAVALGLIAGVFMMAFSWGMNIERTREIIETRTSHIQIHESRYKDDRKMSLFIPEGMNLLNQISARPEIKASTGRILSNGMLSTTKGGFGVLISGVIPEKESVVTRLDQRLVAGEYFTESGANTILIGDKLAEKLGWKSESDSLGADGTKTPASYRLRKKIVLAFQGPDGETKYGSFKVAGVYKTINSKFDETNVFVRFEDLNRLAGTEGGMHEIALLLNDPPIAEDSTFLASFSAGRTDLLIENWKDIAPDLRLVDETFATTLYIFIGIILLALLFGIINTMLMAVMERTRELGMLMSIGMNKPKVFLMIMLETLFLSFVGGPVGLLSGFALVKLFGKVGIDLSYMAESASQMGISSIVYTDLQPQYYFQIALMVFFTAIIAAVYPAYKALQLKPVEAIRAL
ncbi:MAG: FtsX-like permease family protein [Bacteroidia bacterium]|nr:FtsX-like permease family protein [Bacteroidia bacterium]